MTLAYRNRIGEKHITNKGHIIEIITYKSNQKVDIKFEDGVIVKNKTYDNIIKGNISKPINRVGEKHLTNQGYWITIVEYFGVLNCTIQFEDGHKIYKVKYNSIILGQPINLNRRLGEKYITNEGYEIEIIEYFGVNNCTIRFDDGLILQNKSFTEIKNGSIKNPMHPTTYNVGYFGVGKYKSCKNYKTIREYSIWHSLLQRCYCKKAKEKIPTYKEAITCKEWHNFQIFAEWYEKNYNPETMESWHLDKDILVKGNKLYSPETCCFVPKEINDIFKVAKPNKYNLPIGISKSGTKFTTRFNRKYIGNFNLLEEAFQAYKTAKETYIKEIADKWKDKIEPRVYQAMYNYEVEIDGKI